MTSTIITCWTQWESQSYYNLCNCCYYYCISNGRQSQW